jgi:hypothetical protein
MKSLDLEMVPLKQASLCVNCEMITATLGNCPACGSIALINVSRALSHSHYGAKLHSHAMSRAEFLERPRKHAAHLKVIHLSREGNTSKNSESEATFHFRSHASSR